MPDKACHGQFEAFLYKPFINLSIAWTKTVHLVDTLQKGVKMPPKAKRSQNNPTLLYNLQLSIFEKYIYFSKRHTDKKAQKRRNSLLKDRVKSITGIKGTCLTFTPLLTVGTHLSERIENYVTPPLVAYSPDVFSV